MADIYEFSCVCTVAGSIQEGGGCETGEILRANDCLKGTNWQRKSANVFKLCSHVQAGDHERNGEQGSQLQQLPLTVELRLLKSRGVFPNWFLEFAETILDSHAQTTDHTQRASHFLAGFEQLTVCKLRSAKDDAKAP